MEFKTLGIYIGIYIEGVCMEAILTDKDSAGVFYSKEVLRKDLILQLLKYLLIKQRIGEILKYFLGECEFNGVFGKRF